MPQGNQSNPHDSHGLGQNPPALDYSLLLDQLHDGNIDESAFNRLYNYFFPKLTSYAKRFVKSEDKAQDISQDVFLKLLNRPPDTLNNNDLSAWLYSVTQHLAIDRYRRAKRELAWDETAFASSVVDYQDPLTRLLDDCNEQLIQKIKAQLPDDLREIVEMRIDRNIPFKDIASQLSLPLGTALWKMHRAQQLLRKLWDDCVQPTSKPGK